MSIVKLALCLIVVTAQLPHIALTAGTKWGEIKQCYQNTATLCHERCSIYIRDKHTVAQVHACVTGLYNGLLDAVSRCLSHNGAQIQNDTDLCGLSRVLRHVMPSKFRFERDAEQDLDNFLNYVDCSSKCTEEYEEKPLPCEAMNCKSGPDAKESEKDPFRHCSTDKELFSDKETKSAYDEFVFCALKAGLGIEQEKH